MGGAIMGTYKKIGNMSFSVNAPDKLCELLVNLNANRRRIRIFYGDTSTGKCWNDEHDVIGYVGRTTGIRSPILVYNNRSMGGGLILDEHVLKIVDMSGRVLYQVDNFIPSFIEATGLQVYIDGKLHANCKSNQAAIKLAQFMSGKRFAK
jgi:hypothetical protein